MKADRFTCKYWGIYSTTNCKAPLIHGKISLLMVSLPPVSCGPFSRLEYQSFSIWNARKRCCGSKRLARWTKRVSYPVSILTGMGEHFQWATVSPEIRNFGGTRSITDLCAYPLAYYPEKSSVEERLKVRGKVFEDDRGYHYRKYHGITFDDRGAKFEVESQTIIDTAAYKRFNQFHEASLWFKGNAQRVNPGELKFCTASVRGYSMNDRQWLRYYYASQWSSGGRPDTNGCLQHSVIANFLCRRESQSERGLPLASKKCQNSICL